jgi:hypothetical protein
MSEERTKRVARNQAMYRQVNERLEGLNEAFGEISREFRIVCECSDVMCIEQFTVSREVYERTRANPTRFIISRGHQAVGVEKVVQGHADYLVVEKHAGAPRRFAKETDPRDNRGRPGRTRK